MDGKILELIDRIRANNTLHAKYLDSVMERMTDEEAQSLGEYLQFLGGGGRV